MNYWDTPRNEQGIAMAVTLFIVLAVGALATGAAMVGANHSLINRYYDRHSTLEAAADAGLEQTRSLLNANKTFYPLTGYNTIENKVPVTDAINGTLPGTYRTTWVGPSGTVSGQFGVFGSIVSMVEDAGGGKVIRRAEVTQESFAKYAYFTDSEGSAIWFGSGDAIFGPVHSNDVLKIDVSGASFHGTVGTAQTVTNPGYGTFHQGYTEYAPVIPMPTTTDLNFLRTQAMAGGTRVVGNSSGAAGTATTRIEFVAVDLNSDGDSTDANEGFMKVYSSADADYVVGYVDNQQLVNSQTCGARPGGAGNPFMSGADMLAAGWPAVDVADSLETGRRACYLGGAAELTNGFAPVVGPSGGQWLPWSGTVSPLVTAARPADAAYLWPITRPLNPDFKGVVFVDGKVAISGVIRARLTIAATDDIIIADDLTYATDPGLGTCRDIAGLFSGDDVRLAANAINQPLQADPTSPELTYDDTKDEFIHGIILALGMFTVQDFDLGSTSAEPCEAVTRGRGCIYLTGGIIQSVRGPVGRSSGVGNLKRYSYDTCGASNPPPYFPTTGHFVRSQYYEIDPAGFNIASYFASISGGS